MIYMDEQETFAKKIEKEPEFLNGNGLRNCNRSIHIKINCLNTGI